MIFAPGRHSNLSPIKKPYLGHAGQADVSFFCAG